MQDGPRNYIVVTSADNWAKTAALGWHKLGLKSTRRKLANGFKSGDRVVAYYTGLKRFGALLTVSSDCFEEHDRTWSSPNKPGEDYPYRVLIEPEIVLPADSLLDAKDVSARMTYTKKWPAQHWTLAFQGNIHEIPDSDLELIRTDMQDALSSVGGSTGS